MQSHPIIVLGVYATGPEVFRFRLSEDARQFLADIGRPVGSSVVSQTPWGFCFAAVEGAA